MLVNFVKAEYIAMRLARIVGLNVPSVELKSAMNKDVLLVECFDCIKCKEGWQRKMVVSAKFFRNIEIKWRLKGFDPFISVDPFISDKNSSKILDKVKTHAEERLRTHLMKRHKVKDRGIGIGRFPSQQLYTHYGLYKVPTTAGWKSAHALI